MNSNSNKKKKERFKRIAEQRTNKIISTLALLGNCSNKGNYDYNEEQINRIFNAIEEELKNTKMKFESQQKENKKFKL